jgi:predicted ATPase/class 3 adenylate cyclase
MAILPSGTVTFFFTDIEGSTKLWEQYPAAMKVALAWHDDVLRHTIEMHGGYVFKTVGDAFCAAFSTAPDALAVALAVQRSLQREDGKPQTEAVSVSIRVRIALHTGTAEERDADYFGPPVNRVARLLAAGHGGQILLSLATQELVRDQLDDIARRGGVALPVQLRDMGERRLKDLIRPEHIFQIVASDLLQEFPPLKTLDYHLNNLPAQTTPFIGREQDIAAIKQQLLSPDARLLTLTGVGGTGKTRLSLQVAADLLDDFGDGVFFVALAEVRDPALVAGTIAQALEVRETAGKPLLEQLKDYLRAKHVLLVLDNFEQVAEAAPTVSELLSAAPKLKILVTSRNLLRVYGERDYPVSALTLPDPKHLPSLDRLTQYEAVELFIARARAIKSDFAVTNENAPAVAEICYRLDGLPLALELAAARARVLTPQKMLTQLDNRLKFLTSGARDLPARQQTLRGAIDWSHDLLDEPERTLFRRMAVFVGGGTFDAIEAICNATGELDVLMGLESLTDKSLVRQTDSGGEPRFTMLETIREYALERLTASGERDALQRQHAEFYVAWVEDATGRIRSPEQLRWLTQLEQEHNNARAVLAWCQAAQGEADWGAQMAGALMWFWYRRGYASEGRQWLSALLTRATARTTARGRALTRLSFLKNSDVKARPLVEEALAIQRELNHQPGLADALMRMGDTYRFYGQDADKAREYYEQAMSIYQALNDSLGLAEGFIELGHVALIKGEYRKGLGYYRQYTELSRSLGDHFSLAQGLYQMGMAEQALGAHAQALALFEEALARQRELGSKFSIANVLQFMADTELAQNHYVAAREHYQEALVIQRELGNQSAMAHLHGNLGIVAARMGDLETARAQQTESFALYQTLNNAWDLANAHTGWGELERLQQNYVAAREHYVEALRLWRGVSDERMLALALSNLGTALCFLGEATQARALFVESLTLSQTRQNESGVLYALLGLALVAHVKGQKTRALQLCSAVNAQFERRQERLSINEQTEYERAVAELRGQCDEKTFNAAWVEGCALTLEQAIQLAMSDTSGGK